jgi:hypothetical protein
MTLGKPLIGWREWVALPELGISHIKAKIDTGARTSALHACRLSDYYERGVHRVRFQIHPFQRRADVVAECDAEIIDRRWVRDSGGHREKRYVIITAVALGGHSWPIEVTLTDRESMLFRMLLGRTALNKRFTIDAGKSYCLGSPPAPGADPQTDR